MRIFAPAVVLLLALAGCTGPGAEPSEQPPGQAPAPPSSSAPSSPSAAGTPSGAPTASGTPYAGPVADSPACAEVVAGIDDFNTGDFDGTVRHFAAAVPLARAQDDGSVAAGELVEAVRYYAELAPDDYPDAAATSLEFLRWKTVTLGQCVGDGDLATPSPSDPGLPA